MKSLKYFSVFTASTLLLFAACKSDTVKEISQETKVTKEPEKEIAKSTIIEENITYTADNTPLDGFVAYDSSIKTKRPVVLVIHEWWGLNEYPKIRARQLAALGYLAIAVDLYGNHKVAEDPADAGKLAKPIYANPKMAKKRFDAAMAKIKTYPVADITQMAAIGYCFGGAMALNFARLGESELKGIVSFHGNLSGVPITKSILKTKVLVCNGEADIYVNPDEISNFKKQMDSIKADYTFKSYPNATHAFTNPASTEVGKKYDIHIEYNEPADKASWNDMKTFFATIFKK